MHDSGAAIQNILLACHFFDVGACYISDKGTNTIKIREALGISNDAQKISALIWMGRYEQTPTAPARRNLREVYSIL